MVQIPTATGTFANRHKGYINEPSVYDFDCETGSVEIDQAIGSQTIILKKFVNVPVKALVLFFGDNRPEDHHDFHIGIADFQGNNMCHGGFSRNAVTTTRNISHYSVTLLGYRFDERGIRYEEIGNATVSGNEITFDINIASPGDPVTNLSYMAIGGGADVECSVRTWTTPASPSTFSVDHGFEPDAVLAVAFPGNVTEGAASNTNYYVHFWSNASVINTAYYGINARATSFEQSHARDIEAYVWRTTGGTTRAVGTNFATTPTGFQIQATTTTNVVRFISLAIKGCRVNISRAASPTDAPPQQQRHNMGFNAKGSILIPTPIANWNTLGQGFGAMAMGFVDGSQQRYRGSFARNGAPVAETNNHESQTQALIMTTLVEAVKADVSLQSCDLVFDFTNTESTARNTSWMTLGTTLWCAFGIGTFNADSAGTINAFEPGVRGAGTFTANSAGEITQAVAIAAATGTFEADAAGTITTFQAPTATGTFEADTAGVIIVIANATATGTFEADTAGTIQVAGIEVPTATGTFEADTAGTIVIEAVARATGTFEADTAGAISAEPPGGGIGRRICCVCSERRRTFVKKRSRTCAV